MLLDTNIFLELMLGQKRAPECERLLEAVSKGEREATVTHFSIHAMEAILGSGKGLTSLLRNLETSQGLYVYETSVSEEAAVGLITLERKLDFDDALQYYVARKIGAESIVSFDRHLDGLDVPRLEPRMVMESTRRRKGLRTRT